MLPVPKHVAIIMDGNGRWAEQQGLPRTAGHEAGAKRVKEIVREAKLRGVKYLTLYAFSSENWQRPKSEIQALMSLLEEYLISELSDLAKEKVWLRAIGDLDLLPPKLAELITKTSDQLSAEPEFELILALSYGSRQEIVRATKSIAQQVAEGKLAAAEIDEELIAKNLYTLNWPDPELLIRTSNEQRLSNFLLWQLSYAEFTFVPEMWPEFDASVFSRCLDDYRSRDRRFGLINSRDANDRPQASPNLL